jgi:uncharacterized repeat protein (TIGR01451 family)
MHSVLRFLRTVTGAGTLATVALLLCGSLPAFAQSTDLAVTKTGPASTAANTDIAYTITVTNFGPDDTGATNLNDVVPAGTTFVSFVPNAGCTTPAVGGTGAVDCTIASLANGASTSFTLTVHVPTGTAPGTFITNVATISNPTDPNDENNSAAATTHVTGGTSADLFVTKSAPANVGIGQNFSYTIVVGNGGLDPAASASMNDPLPAGLTFVSLSSPAGWSCTTPSVGANGTVNCTVSSSTADPTPENNSSFAASFATAPAPPDLTIAKTHSGTAQQGRTGFTYTITVSNVGTTSTSGLVTVSDTLPAGLTATAFSGSSWSCVVGATSTCTRSDALANGASYPPITLTVNVASNAPALVTNTATVSGGGDTTPGNNSSSDPTIVTAGPVPDLTISKSHTGNARPGQIGFAYTITVSNVGTAASSGTVTVTDTLPAGLTATAASGTGWLCILGATVTCTRSDALAASAAYPPITLTVNVATTVPPSVTNTATVSGGGDVNPANNTASDQTTVQNRPDPTKDPDVVGLINAQMASRSASPARRSPISTSGSRRCTTTIPAIR